jgi:hypothetical protein
MGDIIFEDRHLDSLPLIRDFLNTLFPEAAELRSRLGDNRLWILWQRRHLIVHRRGIVDISYIQKTGDKAAIDTRIALTGYDLDDSFALARDVATSLANVLRGT